MNDKIYLGNIAEKIKDLQIYLADFFGSEEEHQSDMLEEIKLKIRDLRESLTDNQEEMTRIFQLEYIEKIFEKICSDSLALVAGEFTSIDEIVNIFANFQVVYISLLIQIERGENFIQILELTPETTIKIEFENFLTQEKESYKILPKSSLLIPIIENDTRVLITEISEEKTFDYLHKKSKYFSYEIGYYRKENVSLYQEVACLDKLRKIINFPKKELIDKILENVDFEKVGIIKTLKIKNIHQSNLLLKVIYARLVYSLEKIEKIFPGEKRYIIDNCASIVYDGLISTNLEKDLRKVNNCFGNKEEFVKFFYTQCIIFEHLVEKSGNKEYLIPFNQQRLEYDNLRSVVCAVLADDILLDYLYTDMNFSVNFLKAPKNLFDRPYEAEKQSKHLREIISDYFGEFNDEK